MSKQQVSLADAIKQKLAEKKEAQAAANKQQKHAPSPNQQMKSQINKKPNNQKRRTGV
ncbi:hypothetical protein [Paenibacillus hemerocallicola]|jgi:hypothetical protein|uniref:hypothetical protein n=1 Tax=Paenibacillus hemerocallicola TaxID=1172614 RepID=UPI00159ED9DB|nr:hypothetical protein [Paenibacillus hemerocallicola]